MCSDLCIKGNLALGDNGIPPPLFKSVRSDEYAIKAIFLETLWLEEFRCVFNDGDLGVQLVSHDFSSMYIAICYFCSAPSNGEQ